MGLIFGASEVLLAVAKRRGTQDAASDASSLRLIWIIVVVSLTAAFVVAGAFPEGRFRDVELMRGLGIAIFHRPAIPKRFEHILSYQKPTDASALVSSIQRLIRNS